MSYIERSLSEGETVQAVFALHWVSRVPLLLWLLGSILTVGILLPGAIYEYLRVRSIEQGFTNKRVIRKHGIISIKTDEMKLTSIETVEIDQSIWGRILGFGRLHVTGRGISDVVLSDLVDPIECKRRIESISNPVS